MQESCINNGGATSNSAFQINGNVQFVEIPLQLQYDLIFHIMLMGNGYIIF